MRIIRTWWSHIVNLNLSDPVPRTEQWRRVMDADQVDGIIKALEEKNRQLSEVVMQLYETSEGAVVDYSLLIKAKNLVEKT